VAVYALAMGAAICAMWALFLATGQVPELAAEPLRTFGHLAAEFLTGAVLISGGAGLLLRRAWGMAVALTGFGMLLYALGQAIGYWLVTGEVAFVALFTALLALAPILLWRRRPERREWLFVLLGAVLYATVQTIGYFAQQRELVATIMSASLAAGTAATLIAWGSGGREGAVGDLHGTVDRARSSTARPS